MKKKPKSSFLEESRELKFGGPGRPVPTQEEKDAEAKSLGMVKDASGKWVNPPKGTALPKAPAKKVNEIAGVRRKLGGFKSK